MESVIENISLNLYHIKHLSAHFSVKLQDGRNELPDIIEPISS